ncbi:MAG: hypothetical protein OXC63_14370 [Aestuariivita sp.]|nr:hypothetical protein [Aestuariivita sp.]MCY4347640.1 hypothetical protein [Aestuariivita sp.]
MSVFRLAQVVRRESKINSRGHVPCLVSSRRQSRGSLRFRCADDRIDIAEEACDAATCDERQNAFLAAGVFGPAMFFQQAVFAEIRDGMKAKVETVSTGYVGSLLFGALNRSIVAATDRVL